MFQYQYANSEQKGEISAALQALQEHEDFCSVHSKSPFFPLTFYNENINNFVQEPFVYEQQTVVFNQKHIDTDVNTTLNVNHISNEQSVLNGSNTLADLPVILTDSAVDLDVKSIAPEAYNVTTSAATEINRKQPSNFDQILCNLKTKRDKLDCDSSEWKAMNAIFEIVEYGNNQSEAGMQDYISNKKTDLDRNIKILQKSSRLTTVQNCLTALAACLLTFGLYYPIKKRCFNDNNPFLFWTDGNKQTAEAAIDALTRVPK